MEYKFRKYKNSDYDFIFDLKKVCYEKYVAEFFGEWNNDVQKQLFEDFISARSQNIKIVYFDDEKAGFVDGKNIDSNGFEQGNICLLPQFRNQGFGSWYLNKIINSHKKQDIYLKVFKSNPAKKLYEKFGFQKYDETISHYLMVRKSVNNLFKF